jgi:hypothetical protein
MKEHDWSLRVCVYETIDGVTCRNCGAQIYAMSDDGDLDKDCEQANLPLDCEQAVPVVIHEDYKEWDDGAWDEKDDVPQWGKWGVAFSREGNKHFPIPMWRLDLYRIPDKVWLFSKQEYDTYMEAWREAKR